MKIKLFAMLVFAMILIACQNSQAVDYPTGRVTFYIPGAPGGGNDLLARALIPGMAKYLECDIIPENLPGASGGVAAVKVASAKPDGHALYLHSQTIVMMQYLGQPQVDVLKLAPVAIVVEDFAGLCVSANSPIKSISELVDAAKKNPGQVKLGSASAGIWPINVAVFEKAAGITFKYIPYDAGGAVAGTAAAAGEVEACLDSPIVYSSLVESGKLRMLGVFGNQRSPLFPDIPTVREQGVDVDFPVWRAVFTTAGTPDPIMAKLCDAVKVATESPEFKRYVETAGLPTSFRDYKESAPFIMEEDKFYNDMLTELDQKISEPKR